MSETKASAERRGLPEPAFDDPKRGERKAERQAREEVEEFKVEGSKKDRELTQRAQREEHGEHREERKGGNSSRLPEPAFDDPKRREGKAERRAREEVEEFKVEASKKDRELTQRAQREEHGEHGEERRADNSSRLPEPAFDDPKHHLRLYQGDCLEVLAAIPKDSVDLIFADPPYFLSNGGITCHAGKMVSVHKGDWDKSRGPDANHEFNRAWLAACQRVLKPNGSIWVSGTAHVIHSVGFAMQQLGFKLLNDISWVKPNPPPNLSCRYFTHATETIIWAAKNAKSRHTFHYKLMKEINRGKQMKSVWEIYPPEAWEKKFGKHPTQKPVALLERILVASSNEGDLVLDPFSGSGTALLSAFRLRRQALGCEFSAEFLTLSLRRLCSNLVQVDLSLSCVHFSIDPQSDSVDRSKCAAFAKTNRDARMPGQLQLVQQESRFYFIGRTDRCVIFSVQADSLDDARQKFRASGHRDSDALFIIKTETSIYLA